MCSICLYKSRTTTAEQLTERGTSNREVAPLSEYHRFQSNVINTRTSKLTVLIVLLYDQNQLGGDDLSGKVKLKVEPLPTSLSTQILPPCNSTNFFAKVNPSPVPSLL